MPLLALLGNMPWKLIGYGAAALALAGAVMWFRHVLVERDELRTAAAQWESTAKENAKTVEREREQHAKALAAVNTVNEIATIRQAKIVTIKEKIAHAPPAACPMPAVLADALGWLREQSAGAGAATGAGGGAGGAVAPAADAGGSADQPR